MHGVVEAAKKRSARHERLANGLIKAIEAGLSPGFDACIQRIASGDSDLEEAVHLALLDRDSKVRHLGH